MDVGFSEVATRILSLIILVVVLVGVVITCFGVIFAIATWFGKWLLRRKVVEMLISYIQRKSQEWWIKNREQVILLWEFVSEILINPLFYGYTLYVLVNRLESIDNYTKDYPQYNFWQLLDLDMRTDMDFYIVFIIIFTLWMLGRVWKHRQELQRQKSIEKNLGEISDELRDMNTKLGDLPTNVRRKLEKEDDEPKSEHFKSVL